MRKQALVLAAVIMMTMGTAKAQIANQTEAAKYQKANVVMAEKNYAAALRTGNDGVIESSLGLVAKMKLNLLDKKFSTLEDEVFTLMTKGQTARIRYQAYLTYSVLTSPELFTADAQTEYKDNETLFTALAKRMQQTYTSASFSR